MIWVPKRYIAFSRFTLRIWVSFRGSPYQLAREERSRRLDRAPPASLPAHYLGISGMARE